MNLPEDFCERMKRLLGDEYVDFIKSYNSGRAYGLRINPLKVTDTECLPFNLSEVPWAKEGFYTEMDEYPGKNPLHEAGVYYIQEPSAMSVVGLLSEGAGDIICDLCAAPGGKSTHIAGKLSGKGLLVANEISDVRAKKLSQNIERFGIVNTVVCNETPDRMAEIFENFFDCIIVDAPCSGEGMFRKDETAIREWSLKQVEICAKRQEMILGCADKMLKAGGILVYSTCTFAPEEDEDMLVKFLRMYRDYVVEDWKELETAERIKRSEFMGNVPESGRISFVSKELLPLSDREKSGIEGAMRLWPHKVKGEGHFAVRLRKSGSIKGEQIEDKCSKKKYSKKNIKERHKNVIKNPELKELERLIKEIFADEILESFFKNGELRKRLIFFGDELYLMAEHMPSIEGVKIMRGGLHVASMKKNRFEPAHALAKAAKPECVKQYYDCDFNTAVKYLHGDIIECGSNLKGWVLVGYKGFSLGFGKANNGVIKNHYPKGLRIKCV